jgi:hypothetical protein
MTKIKALVESCIKDRRKNPALIPPFIPKIVQDELSRWLKLTEETVDEFAIGLANLEKGNEVVPRSKCELGLDQEEYIPLRGPRLTIAGSGPVLGFEHFLRVAGFSRSPGTPLWLVSALGGAFLVESSQRQLHQNLEGGVLWGRAINGGHLLGLTWEGYVVGVDPMLEDWAFLGASLSGQAISLIGPKTTGTASGTPSR